MNMPNSSASTSPSKNRRMDLHSVGKGIIRATNNGTLGCENTDGSTYYHNGQNYGTYQHLAPARSWGRDPDQKEDNRLRMQFGGDKDERALAFNVRYQVDNFTPAKQSYPSSSYGYDGNDSEPDAMAPPYSGRDQKPPTSLPQMQTARRGRPKQTPKRRVYAHLGGGAALSTYPIGIVQTPMPTARRSTISQSPGGRGRGASASQPPALFTYSNPWAPKMSQRPLQPAATAPTDPAGQKCSQCQVPGHDSRDCPLNRFGLGKSAGISQGLPQQGFRGLSERTTTSSKMTTMHSTPTGVLHGRISKPKATQKKTAVDKK